MKKRAPSDRSQDHSDFDRELLAENLRLHRKIVKQEVAIASLKNKIAALQEEVEVAKNSGLQTVMAQIAQRAGRPLPKGRDKPTDGHT